MSLVSGLLSLVSGLCLFLALPCFIVLGFIIGCHDEMSSVGYVSGPSFLPFEGVLNAIEEYGLPGGLKGAFRAFYIWLGLISLWVILLLFAKVRDESYTDDGDKKAP